MIGMAVRHVPLLKIQRGLYDHPPGRERFLRYLEAMTGGEDGLALPLAAFNPMGKPHVSATLDALIDLGAEEIAAGAVEEASATIEGLPDARIGLVVVDDRGGGWTNRSFIEIERRLRPDAHRKWGWLTAALWTSDPPTPAGVRSEVLATLFLVAEQIRSGPPKTLRELLRREGLASAFAGRDGPILEADDLAYSREILRDHLDADAGDPTIIVPCLFGDDAARSVGYTPLGLSAMAGIATARADAGLGTGGEAPSPLRRGRIGATLGDRIEGE